MDNVVEIAHTSDYDQTILLPFSANVVLNTIFQNPRALRNISFYQNYQRTIASYSFPEVWELDHFQSVKDKLLQSQTSMEPASGRYNY